VNEIIEQAIKDGAKEIEIRHVSMQEYNQRSIKTHIQEDGVVTVFSPAAIPHTDIIWGRGHVKKARRLHLCSMCLKEIEKGEKYIKRTEHIKVVEEGGYEEHPAHVEHKYCLACGATHLEQWATTYVYTPKQEKTGMNTNQEALQPVQKTQAIQIPTDSLDLQTLGKIFYSSGLFTDIKSEAQAIVKILAGAENGFTPFTAMTNIHLIPSRGGGLSLELAANAVAIKIKESRKYDYKILKITGDECSIQFFECSEITGGKWEGGPTRVSTFSRADAEKAGLLRTFKSGEKSNYDKFARNMFFSRAMTNGQAWFCADVFQSRVYGLGEISGLPKDEPPEEEFQTTEPTKDISKDDVPDVLDPVKAATLDQILRELVEVAPERYIEKQDGWNTVKNTLVLSDDDQTPVTDDHVQKWIDHYRGVRDALRVAKKKEQDALKEKQLGISHQETPEDEILQESAA
jgi:hypothetical protein